MQILVPRREAMLTLLRCGVERGELRDDVDLELVVDLIAGPVIYRFLIDRGTVADPAGRALEVYDAIAEGLAPRSVKRPR